MPATRQEPDRSPPAPGGPAAGSGVVGRLRQIDGLFGRLTAVLNLVGTVWIVVITVLVVVDVVGLAAFSAPVPAVKELIQLSIPGIVFLQLANTLREDRHVSSDVLMQIVKTKRPRVAAFFYALFNLIGAGLMGLMAILMYPKAMQAYLEGFTRGAQGVATLPEWPSMALVVLGAMVMAIQYFLFFLRDGLAVFIGSPPVDRKSRQFVE
jgi:TRAP-type mannitol/chloroaromatic compound transport system permease small subunit